MKIICILMVCLIIGTPLIAGEINHIVVLPFRISALPDSHKEQVEKAYDLLIANLSTYTEFTTVERTQIDAVLAELKLTGNEPDAAAIKQIGAMSRSKHAVIGSISQLDTTIIINARLVDIETGELLAGHSITSAGLDDLAGKMKRLSTELAQYIISPADTVKKKNAPRIAVLDFKHKGVANETAGIVTDLVTTLLANNKKLRVIERVQLKTIMQQIALSAGDDLDDTQVVKVGNLANAKLIVLGTILKIGPQIIINIRVIDGENGRITMGKSIPVDRETGLIKAASQVVDHLGDDNVVRFETFKPKQTAVVLKFSSNKKLDYIARLITENFVSALPDYNKYTVLERMRLIEVLKELHLGATDDFSERDMLEIGRMARAKLIIIGSVSRIGAKLMFSTRSIDVEKGVTVGGGIVYTSLEDEIPEAADMLAQFTSTVRNGTQNVVDFDKIKQEAARKDLYQRTNRLHFAAVARGLGLGLLGTGMSMGLSSPLIYDFAYNVNAYGSDNTASQILTYLFYTDLAVGSTLTVTGIVLLGLSLYFNINAYFEGAPKHLGAWIRPRKTAAAATIIGITAGVLFADMLLFFLNSIWIPDYAVDPMPSMVSMFSGIIVVPPIMITAIVMGAVSSIKLKRKKEDKEPELHPILAISDKTITGGLAVRF